MRKITDNARYIAEKIFAFLPVLSKSDKANAAIKNATAKPAGKTPTDRGKRENTPHTPDTNFKRLDGINSAISRLTGNIAEIITPAHNVKNEAVTSGISTRLVTNETSGKYPKRSVQRGIDVIEAAIITDIESLIFFGINERAEDTGAESAIIEKLTAKDNINPAPNKSNGLRVKTTIKARAIEFTLSFFSPTLPTIAPTPHITAALTEEAVIPHR